MLLLPPDHKFLQFAVKQKIKVRLFYSIMGKEITTRAQDYSQWYNDLVIKGGLADYSAVRGCMVIKPYGYGLWENMLELTAIVITCAAGVVMGISYVFPGTRTRLQALQEGVKDGVKIVIGLVPVFGIAAFFEGFITGLYKMPFLLNLFLLSLSAGFIIWYFMPSI